jgi:ectoine hydroxylase-related dioxygenase (phytanoyl-CoA dioxygenase family)
LLIRQLLRLRWSHRIREEQGRPRSRFPAHLASGNLIGYEGDDPGVVVPVGRGGIVAMSSALFHRSGPNTTPQPRRAFLVSYSAPPILNPQGGD